MEKGERMREGVILHSTTAEVGDPQLNRSTGEKKEKSMAK
jgi:hypothetical protein